MASDEILILNTGRSAGRIIADGVSKPWTLNAARGRKCAAVLFTQNLDLPKGERDMHDMAPHGCGFLICRVRDITTIPGKRTGRRVIHIEAYAHIKIAGVWGDQRNPVAYTTAAALGLDLNAVDFLPVGAKPSPAAKPKGLSMAEAKIAMANFYGVDPDKIVVTIHG